MKEAGKTIIVACASLREYVELAQRNVGTAYEVLYLDRKYHRDPNEMRGHVTELLQGIPKDTETVLVVMGFCGGSWEGVSAPCRLVLPRVDDCYPCC